MQLGNQKFKLKGISVSLLGLFLFVFVPKIGSSQTDATEEISSKITRNFSPSYTEYSAKDTFRKQSLVFRKFIGKKLIFHDDLF